MIARWSVDIPGQPASGNAKGIRTAYRTTRTGARVSYPQIANRAEVDAYIAGAVHLIRVARPSGWRHDGALQLRITYELWLARDMDCDNVSKPLGDALKIALDVDDAWFLPTFSTKVVGANNPHVRITVEPFERCGCCGR